jgi:glycosyltransferase involved in cell wall biosynthesis
VSPNVSVIIPVLNGARHIGAAIQSALDQTLQAHEIIVVDDGSTDNTNEVIAAFESVTYIFQENQRQGPARNRGVAESSGMYIAFLDADDRWNPDKLAKQIEYLEAHPEDGFVICHFTPELIETDQWPANLHKEYYLSNPPAYFPSGLLVRRSVFEQVGPFVREYSEDSDWIFRARDVGVTHGIVPKVLLIKGIRTDADTRATNSMQSQLLRHLRASLHRRPKEGDDHELQH